nr:DEAD-like helicase [Mimivirus sp.]URM62531.1 DEAD helicase [Mimivirus sp.]
MVGRIRQINDPNILCYYKGPTYIDSSIYTYDDVLSYFRYYENINGRKILENVEYDKHIIGNDIVLKRKTDISLFDHISIYNEVEQLNKNPVIFMTILNKLIQKSGHILKFNIINKPKYLSAIDNIDNLADILADIDETKYVLSELLKKQSKNNLSAHEKLVIKKFFFIKNFGIRSSKNKNEFTKFYDLFNNKLSHIKRFAKFFRYNIYDKDQNENGSHCDEIDNFNDGKDKVRHKIIVDFINRFLFLNKKCYNSEDLLNITINNDQYNKAIKDISINSFYFKNEEYNRSLFSIHKGKSKSFDNTNIKHYVNTIIHLLEMYGIKISRGKRVQINKKEDSIILCLLMSRLRILLILSLDLLILLITFLIYFNIYFNIFFIFDIDIRPISIPNLYNIFLYQFFLNKSLNKWHTPLIPLKIIIIFSKN